VRAQVAWPDDPLLANAWEAILAPLAAGTNDPLAVKNAQGGGAAPLRRHARRRPKGPPPLKAPFNLNSLGPLRGEARHLDQPYPLQALVDTGAARDYISTRVVIKAGLAVTATTGADVERARLPNGAVLTSPGFAIVPLLIAGCRIERNFIALENEHDIILGVPFMEDFDCAWRPGHAQLTLDGATHDVPYVVPTSPRSRPTFSAISAKQLLELMATGDPDYTYHVVCVFQSDGESPDASDGAGGAPPPPFSSFSRPFFFFFPSNQTTNQTPLAAVQATSTPSAAATLTLPDGTVEQINGDPKIIRQILPDLQHHALLFTPPKAGPKRPGADYIEHQINLKPGVTAVRRGPFRISQRETLVLKKAPQENLGAGFIVPSRCLKENYAARGRKTHLDTHVERKQRASTRAVDRALGCYSYRLGDTDIPSISVLAVARV